MCPHVFTCAYMHAMHVVITFIKYHHLHGVNYFYCACSVDLGGVGKRKCVL